MAVILFVIIGLVGNFIINLKEDPEQKTAYKIEIPETENESSSKSLSGLETLEPISPLLINASLNNGEKISKKCGACHNYAKDSKSKVGPNLWDIIDRPKGNISGYAYSNALVNHGGKWSYEELNGFLHKPLKYIKGTKMAFAGLRKEMDRANIIAYLNSMGDSPKSLK